MIKLLPPDYQPNTFQHTTDADMGISPSHIYQSTCDKQYAVGGLVLEGLVLGIVSAVLSALSTVGLMLMGMDTAPNSVSVLNILFAIPFFLIPVATIGGPPLTGIVLSALGLHSSSHRHRTMARWGLVLSIIGLILAVISLTAIGIWWFSPNWD